MIVDLPMFTLMHVVISALGIIAGLVIVGGLTAGARMNALTVFFLATTILVAPTQQEPSFVVTQALLLAFFVWLGWAALKGFRTTNHAW
jgi:hypothetical protein